MDLSEFTRDELEEQFREFKNTITIEEVEDK